MEEELKRLRTESLKESRDAALAKRRKTIDEWTAKDGALDPIRSLEAFETFGNLKSNTILQKYLYGRTVTAPSLVKAKHAAVEHFSNVTRSNTLRDEAEEEMKATEIQRRTTLLQELHALGLELRSDSALCALYIKGTSQKPATEVAKIMAKMRYVHNHVSNYHGLIENEVEELAYANRGFFPGIYQEATENVQATIQYPEKWPWLESSTNSSTKTKKRKKT